MPVLPPSDASTMASSVVGASARAHPRMYTEAAKAARSHTTPPPTPSTVASLPSPEVGRPGQDGFHAAPPLRTLPDRQRHRALLPGIRRRRDVA